MELSAILKMVLSLIFALSATLFLLFILHKKVYKQHYDAAAQFNGPPAYPFFGNVLEFMFKDSKGKKKI